ncbi:MAG: hypothetical protein EZS28_030362 [Streblomastix strix]|uniref:Uncharacterized protein n=1 Tax=Streblomastix strix TaxID=222440 RepID=A0A5J4UVI3_9EUKA|nr:MAG: hypothetical protein EZS28_030362 [Streblomastix strix]
MSHAIQPSHALRLIQEQGSQDLVNPQAGQYSATAMGPGQQIPQLVTFSPTQIILHFYTRQLILRSQIQQPFQGFGMCPGMQQFQDFPQPGFFQQTQPSSDYSIQLYRQPSVTEAPSYAGHPTFQSGLHKISQPLWNKEISQRMGSPFIPVDLPELSINMNQHQFNAHRNFWAQRSYTLRQLGLKASGEHHRGFVEGLINVNVFIQRHARHEHLTVNDCKVFQREVDTDLYLDTVRMELDEDDNHHHHHDHDHDHDRNHRHDRERNDRDNQLDLGRGRKRRRVIQSVGSDNVHINDDWAEFLHRKAQPPIQTVTGAPVYMSSL